MFKTITQHGSFNTTSKPKPRERFKPEIQFNITIVHLILFLNLRLKKDFNLILSLKKNMVHLMLLINLYLETGFNMVLCI